MLSDVSLEKALMRIVKRGSEFSDIFIEKTVTNSLVWEDEKLEKIVCGRDMGMGLRAIFNKKTAYAYTNEINDRALEELMDFVTSSVTLTDGEANICLIKTPPSINHKFFQIPEEIPIERKITLIMNADRVARKKDRRIKQVRIIYRDVTQKLFIANTEGKITEEFRIYTSFVIQVVASSDGILQTGYERVGALSGFEIFEEHPAEIIAEAAANRALLMLTARKAPAGGMPVVISSEAGGTLIHEAIGHGLEADHVQEGHSIFAGKIGERVASPLVSVIDDGTIPNRWGSFSFDDEGTPSQKTILVENGILKGFMYDILTAMKDGVSSTGNGRRESYHHKPIPRMTNTYIAPGESSPDEIIRSLEKGILVKKMGGGQVNTITGDFVFEVDEAYLIEKGKISEPVRGAVLTGNGPEILMAIDMVGNDPGFSIGMCGKDGQGVPVSDGMPTIRIPEKIIIGGEELIRK